MQHNAQQHDGTMFGWVNTIAGLVFYVFSKYILHVNPTTLFLQINIADIAGLMSIFSAGMGLFFWTIKVVRELRPKKKDVDA